MFTQGQESETASSLRIGLAYDCQMIFGKGDAHRTVELEFQRTEEGAVSLTQEIVRETRCHKGPEECNAIDFTEGELPLDTVETNDWLGENLKGYLMARSQNATTEARMVRSRCFLDLEMKITEEEFIHGAAVSFSQQLGSLITNVIYIPGLRDPDPARSYPRMPIAEQFPGPMHSCLASVIHHWGPGSDQWDKLEQDLRALDLTGKVAVHPVDDTSLEVQVGRYIPGSRQALRERVSRADVGPGLSQIMPVLVALQAAQPNHLVVMEHPELHLHPRGIHKLAVIIAEAVNRGVRVIMETHSELLLLGLQTQVAKGLLNPELVSLNWFELDEQGHSCIQQTEVGRDGSFGDWPVDFLDVELQAQKQYLDAASLP